MGLLQILPRTAQSLGFTRLTDPEECTHAGIAYMAQLMDQLEPDLALQQRVRFALAAYNVGLGHLTDARRLAGELGLDTNSWFGNVEKAMLELQKPVYYRRARYGYARGSEPVKYVIADSDALRAVPGAAFPEGGRLRSRRSSCPGTSPARR